MRKKYNVLGDLTNSKNIYFLTVLQSGNPRSECRYHSLPGLQTATLLMCTHMVKIRRDLSLFSYEATNPIFLTPFNLTYLLKSLYPNIVTLGLEFWVTQGPQHLPNHSDGILFPNPIPVSYTHLTLPTTRTSCRSRWSPYH